MSFTPEPELLRSLDDLGTLRALANPVRQRLLNHLMSFGPRTASQCAAVTDATASNCSYHLRELARYGLVERVSDRGSDGRERLWRSVATGLLMDLDSKPGDPAVRAAELALTEVDLNLSNSFADRAVAQWSSQPADWRAASTLRTYALRLSAAELAGLIERLDSLIRPYLGLTRGPIDGAEVVHLRLDAFRHPDAS